MPPLRATGFTGVETMYTDSTPLMTTPHRARPTANGYTPDLIYNDLVDMFDEDNPQETMRMAGLEIANGNSINAMELLLSIFSPREAERVYRELEEAVTVVSEQDTLGTKIQRYLRGEKVSGVDDKIVEEYYNNEKKIRFLQRNERLMLHKPKSDGKKPTSSAMVDDILPIN